MKVLIVGRHGQVARELQARLQGRVGLIALGHEQLDLADHARIRERVCAQRPDLIVNAAAHTAVDQAESEPERAFAINATAPGLLAEAAAELGAPLIHYSTDYVFDGGKPTPYVEDDPTAPLGVYGQSKLAGEQAVRSVGGAHLILRTSWVYSRHGRNFLLTMQRLLREREELSVVDDQIGAPTWAGSIAGGTAQIIEQWRAGNAAWGTYHLTCQGSTSWFGFASAIAEQLRTQGKRCARLVPIPTSAYPTPTRRPLNSRLDGARLKAAWQIELPSWQAALAACLDEQNHV
jgi:dTDP-4-dehydrorhamnose reductase